MNKIFLMIALLGIACSVSACKDMDYYDYGPPTPPVSVTNSSNTYYGAPSNSGAYYGHRAPNRSGAYYGHRAPSSSGAYYGDSSSSASYGASAPDAPSVSVSPSSSGAHYGN